MEQQQQHFDSEDGSGGIKNIASGPTYGVKKGMEAGLAVLEKLSSKSISLSGSDIQKLQQLVLEVMKKLDL